MATLLRFLHSASQFPAARRLRRSAMAVALLATFAGCLAGQTKPGAAPTILFIGNSFTYGARSPVQFFRAGSVTDLNGDGIGGVPALFKAFANEAGLSYEVFLETRGGVNFDFHVKEKAAVIGRPWDFVVMHGYSTLDKDKPGDPTSFVQYGKVLAELLRSKNPRADIRVTATWSRADQTYPQAGHWHGQPIEKMALDLRAACDLLAAASPAIKGVIAVGEAWNRAIRDGIADPNPYDGIAAGQLNLWTYDHYHASAFGYYLEALMVFGDLTGLDPRSLGENERAAFELGFSAAQASALQKVAAEELSAAPGRARLKSLQAIRN
jgi:hypothetical protein